jgi:hypothetical protein
MYQMLKSFNTFVILWIFGAKRRKYSFNVFYLHLQMCRCVIGFDRLAWTFLVWRDTWPNHGLPVYGGMSVFQYYVYNAIELKCWGGCDWHLLGRADHVTYDRHTHSNCLIAPLLIPLNQPTRLSTSYQTWFSIKIQYFIESHTYVMNNFDYISLRRMFTSHRH